MPSVAVFYISMWIRKVKHNVWQRCEGLNVTKKNSSSSKAVDLLEKNPLVPLWFSSVCHFLLFPHTFPYTSCLPSSSLLIQFSSLTSALSHTSLPLFQLYSPSSPLFSFFLLLSPARFTVCLPSCQNICPFPAVSITSFLHSLSLVFQLTHKFRGLQLKS